MAIVFKRTQQIVQKGSNALDAHRPLVCVAVLCATVASLRQVFPAPSIDFILWVGAAVYFLDACSARTTERATKARTSITTKSAVDKVAFGGGYRASPAVPSEEGASPVKLNGGHGSSKDSVDQFGHGSWRLNADMQIIDCVLTDGVAHTTSKVLEVMHACIRLGHGGAAVKLFDQMLIKGATPDAHRVHKAVAHKFFELLANSLDDKCIRQDGLRLLGLIQAHGIAPSPSFQNRMLDAWKNQLPESVLKCFLEMKSAGVILSRWAYRYVVVAHERSDPEFSLKTFSEMTRSGVWPDRATYNAVLGACSQLCMHDTARELFAKMADFRLLPNEKTYGIMIKVYSSTRRDEGALALLERMREQCLKPDRYAYHHAIRSCIALRRVEHAAALYNDMVQAKVPPLTSTCVLLSGACNACGKTSLEAKIMADLARVKEAEAANS